MRVMAIPYEYNTLHLQEQLSIPFELAARVMKLARSAESSWLECAALAKQVDSLARPLRSLVRIGSTTHSLYQQPVERIVTNMVKNLARALTLVGKCKHRRRVFLFFSTTTRADFRQVSNLLESSIGDIMWLWSIFEFRGAHLSPPPIACHDPILGCVWSYIATIQMGRLLKDRVDAANSLVSLARNSNRNKQIIVEEGGVGPLLKLLKEGSSSPDARMVAANALSSIAVNPERVRIIVNLVGVPVIVSVLGDSPIPVQVSVVKLLSKMAELDPVAREEFARENVTRHLVLILDDQKLHSIDILKAVCAKALWKLCEGCLSNCRNVTETEQGLIFLAYIIDKEEGDLQFNCLMTLVEIAAVAEANPDLRRTAFKPKSPDAKAVFDQLLRLIEEKTTMSNWKLKILAIEAIGSLARTFLAGQAKMVVGPLVAQIGSKNVDVAAEAVIALGKFVCVENFNCVEHSKTVIEFDGVPCLLRLLESSEGSNEWAHLHCLVVVCYLVLNVGSSRDLEQAHEILKALEGVAAAGRVVVRYPGLRDLVAKAIHHLTLYQAGAYP